VWVQYTNVTDRQTDRETDTERQQRPHLRIASRGKKSLSNCFKANYLQSGQYLYFCITKTWFYAVCIIYGCPYRQPWYGMRRLSVYFPFTPINLEQKLVETSDLEKIIPERLRLKLNFGQKRSHGPTELSIWRHQEVCSGDDDSGFNSVTAGTQRYSETEYRKKHPRKKSPRKKSPR